MKTLRILLSVLIIPLPVIGCAGMITGGDLIRPGEATGIIEVVNDYNQPQTVVLISTCNASTYGLNRLNNGERIPANGGRRRFTVSAGCWDVGAGIVGHGQAGFSRVTVMPNRVSVYRVH